MDYRILALGDVASETGLQLLQRKLWAFRRERDVAFAVVNGENISGSGLTRVQAEELLAAGADVITLGNHTFGKPQIAAFSAAVLVLIGRCGLDFNADNPFTTADRLLKTADKPTFTLVELHAQATSEKLAMAYYLDGRVSALWGTHTHVPTADQRVFQKGTGYVTDPGRWSRCWVSGRSSPWSSSWAVCLAAIRRQTGPAPRRAVSSH